MGYASSSINEVLLDGGVTCAENATSNRRFKLPTKLDSETMDSVTFSAHATPTVKYERNCGGWVPRNWVARYS